MWYLLFMSPVCNNNITRSFCVPFNNLDEAVNRATEDNRESCSDRRYFVVHESELPLFNLSKE